VHTYIFRSVVCSSSAAAATTENTFNPLGLNYKDVLAKNEKVLSLPPPPQASDFQHVLPYLIR
jgi:hypothetical protein